MPAAAGNRYTPEERIDEAFETWDTRASETKARCQRWDLLQTLFPPLAALLLSFQVVVLPDGGPIAKALIVIELAVLFLALVLALLRADLAGVSWVPFRLRAEALRREQFLFLARVGAYLNCADRSDLAAAVRSRLAILNSEAEQPREFIPLTNPVNEPWRHTLEDLRYEAPDTDGIDDAYIERLPTLCRHYYEERLLHQKEWYQGRVHRHRASDNLWESAGRVALAGALVAAAMHLTAMHTGPSAATEGFGQWIVVAAIGLPPISAAFSEIQALLQGRQLSLSYSQYESDLAHLDAQFSELLSELQCRAEPDAEMTALAFRFKRLVLEAEELFAAEMRTWSVLMAPND